MILRLSQKLNAKIKGGELVELPLDENPYADWSCHVFNAGRTQYVILTSTPSLYSCLMPGRGITDSKTFIARFLETVQEFTEENGQRTLYEQHIATSAGAFTFANSRNRSVTGSMSDHIHAARRMLGNELPHSKIYQLLNDTPMSALHGPDGRKYDFPKRAFVNQTAPNLRA